ncbi:MAG: major capsid protein [Henriciella sp.]
MTAITLLEYRKSAPDNLTKAVIDIYAQTSDLLAAMPWMTISGGAYPYIIEDAPGGIAFRGVNESYTPSTGVENPQVESLFIAGGEADVDNFLIRTQGEGRRSRETNKKIKNLAKSVTDVIIGGDNTSNPREFDGIQNRLTGRTLLHNSTASGGAALSLTALDEAIQEVQEPTHLLMSRKLRTKFTSAMRNQTLAGNMDLVKDDFGRDMFRYAGLPMLVGYEVGPEGDVLPFTEIGNGGGAAQTSSIYILSLKEGNMCGIQSAPVSAKDLGELESKPARRTRIEWDCGMVIENPYAAARLTSITNAAIVA